MATPNYGIDLPTPGLDVNVWGANLNQIAFGEDGSPAVPGNTVDKVVKDVETKADTAETNAQQGITDAAAAQGTADTAEANAQQALTDAAAANTNADTKLPKDGTEPMTGRLDMVTATVRSGAVTSSGTITLNLATANYFEVTLNGTATIDFSNIPNEANQQVAAIVRVISSGNSYSWAPSFQWPGGSPPTPSNGTDLYATTFKPGGVEDAWRVAENLS